MEWENDFQPLSISYPDLGGNLIFAIDVAKVDMVAALARADGRVLQTICWKALEQNPIVLSILRNFRTAGVTIETVMEPSGTYGDVLRHQLEQEALPVFMVSGKRTHDAKEIYDGVPRLHDAKVAAILSRLHADGLSTRLPVEVPERRQLHAALAIMDLHQERYLQLVHRLESWLARHWPELPTLLELTSSSLMALLARIGGPADVAANPDQATKLLLGIGHRLIPNGHRRRRLSRTSRLYHGQNQDGPTCRHHASRPADILLERFDYQAERPRNSHTLNEPNKPDPYCRALSLRGTDLVCP